MTTAQLKESVYLANMALVREGLVKLTWGNASGIDRARGLVAIKPSGVPYDEMTPDDMVILDLEGNTVEGKYRPSSDAPTHLVLYQAFAGIGGIVHTHSTWATVWAQACRGIPCMGTTHADYFYGEVPCTRMLSRGEIFGEYEKATGEAIAERFRKIDPLTMPGVLVAEHGPFTWGKNTADAVSHAIILEEVARMAFHTFLLSGEAAAQKAIIEKHYLRKHGPDAYYGQNKS